MQKLKQSYTSTNVPLMRYANVLLMQAEIHNEQGHPELAAPLINDIRKYMEICRRFQVILMIL